METDSAGSLTVSISMSLIKEISSGLDKLKQYNEMITNITEEVNLSETDIEYYEEELKQ